MSAQCVRCERPTADGYACTPCANRAAGQLRTIADLTEAARDVAHGFSRRGGGGASGKPGSRSPANDDALDVLHEVTDTLRSRIKLIEEERGFEIVSTLSDGGLVPDPLVQAATALCGQLEWLRHTLWADEGLSEIEECSRMIRWCVDGPAPKRYLGPCGMTWDVGVIEDRDRTLTCEGDVYVRPGGDYGTCRTCGARHESKARQAWLDGEVRSHAYTAAEIAAAYPIKANTIRQWLARGLLVAHGEMEGRPLLNLGEVLDLAAGDAARREEARARRAAAREAAEMGA